MKVRCIESKDRHWKIGNIYEFKDGHLHGYENYVSAHYKDINHWNNNQWNSHLCHKIAKFEEVKEMQFKVGDKVRVRCDLIADEFYGGVRFDKLMNNFAGQITEIVGIENNKFLNLGNNDWYWSGEMLEKLEDNIDIFTKSDLKTGMRVKMRNGDLYAVLKDINIKYSGHQEIMFCGFDGGFMPGDSYNDDLLITEKQRDSNMDDYDIMSVFEYPNNSNILSKQLGDFVWERKSTKEMTIEEIQDQFGYKIKIVE